MKKQFILVILIVAMGSLLFAEERQPLSFSIKTDFAWYPKSAYIADTGSHFAPITGLYSGLQARTTINASYRIPVLTSANPLFAGNNITFTGNFEITPITLMPKLSVTFTPIAFLTFSAGTMAGSGWDLIGMQAIAQYNVVDKKYDDLTPFRSWFLKEWASCTFMFDVAALWPGEWHHIVTVATYEVDYITLTNKSSTVWEWQTGKNYADGLMFYQLYILGYQMPKKVSLVGVMAEFTGHYNGADYGEYADSINGTFVTADISPLMNVAFTKKDSVIFMLNFESRRSFAEEHGSTNEEPLLTCTGSEWFFNRVALSWTHSF